MGLYTKIITLDDHFPTGEPTVQLITSWGRNGQILREKTSCHKTAAHSPALDYIRSVSPEPGKSIVLVVGLGDHETYGPNRNGDGFPSEPIRGKIASNEVLPLHYKSYENAHVFEHHVNSDPAKAIGRVKKAFWNPHMRRVELVEDFDHGKAPHLLEKIAAGEYPAKSMGCRIRYDVCSNCGNKARTRAEYCDHLKYAMSQIDANSGEQNAALNPSPVFFDSSWVVRPADRTGYMLKKVAKDNPYELWSSSFELGEVCDDLATKSATLRKAADIEKILGGAPAASVSNLDSKDARLMEKYKNECACSAKPNDDKVVRMMLTYKPSEALGTANDVGLPLGLRDLLKYFLGRMTDDKDPAVGESTVKSASRHVGLIFNLYETYPRFYDDLLKVGHFLDGPTYNQELATKLASFTPGSVTQDYAYRNVVPEMFRENERPLTDMVGWTDPNTGQQYSTNYGTVQKTHDALVERGLKQKAVSSLPLLGGSALLGAASLGMGMSPKLRGLPQLVTGAGAALAGFAGARNLMRDPSTTGPRVMTDQGETISGWTEMVPKTGSSLAPEIFYTQKRATDGSVKSLPTAYCQAFLQQMKTAEVTDEASLYLGPTLDLDIVALALGKSILSWIE